MRLKFFYRVLSITISIGFLFSVKPVYAAVSYDSYTYSFWNEAVPSPQAYLPSKVIDGKTLGLGDLKDPSDLFVSRQKKVFLLDSGNNRIICMDRNWKVTAVLDRFVNSEGEEDKFNNPRGMFVNDEGNIFIADTDNGRIVKLDPDGRFLGFITKPKSEILPANFTFRPLKICVDSGMRSYVLVASVFDGLMEFDVDGNFTGFTGANKVSPSITDYFWSIFSTREQKKRMVEFVPNEFTGLTIDNEGFIYTTTGSFDYQALMGSIDPSRAITPVRRQNPTGDDILRRISGKPPIGDLPPFPPLGTITGSSYFNDVVTRDAGMYSCLDLKRCRVFTYNSDGYLLYVFGGSGNGGNQLGTFKSPVAVEALDDQILVLDSSLSQVTVFDVTDYGKAINDAVILHYSGKYEESTARWEQVLRLNSNFELAYVGIGKSLLRQDRYKEAMKYFKLGNDRQLNSKAFKLYREEVISKYFGKFILVIAVMLLLIAAFRAYRKLVKEEGWYKWLKS